MYICLHKKYPLILSHFNETGIVSTYFREVFKHQTSKKIRQVGTGLFLADG